jgi:hypothetical protein
MEYSESYSEGLMETSCVNRLFWKSSRRETLVAVEDVSAPQASRVHGSPHGVLGVTDIRLGYSVNVIVQPRYNDI